RPGESHRHPGHRRSVGIRRQEPAALAADHGAAFRGALDVPRRRRVRARDKLLEAEAAHPMNKRRLHVGCGPQLLEGWINIDNQPYKGVDAVVDIRNGVPYENLELIFAEHFIEHLSYDAAQKFLRDCRRALGPDGVLRLTTPNLDWVWLTQYHPGQWQHPSEAVRDCFWMNKAFRGWGHQFLYNEQTLTECLHEAGFAAVEPVRYGESR